MVIVDENGKAIPETMTMHLRRVIFPRCKELAESLAADSTKEPANFDVLRLYNLIQDDAKKRVSFERMGCNPNSVRSTAEAYFDKAYLEAHPGCGSLCVDQNTDHMLPQILVDACKIIASHSSPMPVKKQSYRTLQPGQHTKKVANSVMHSTMTKVATEDPNRQEMLNKMTQDQPFLELFAKINAELTHGKTNVKPPDPVQPKLYDDSSGATLQKLIEGFASETYMAGIHGKPMPDGAALRREIIRQYRDSHSSANDVSSFSLSAQIATLLNETQRIVNAYLPPGHSLQR